MKIEWKHKNLIMFVGGVVMTTVISRTEWFHLLLNNVGSWGYIGAFVGGMMFASTFTLTTGALLLITLSKTLSPFILILFGGLGAVTSDLMIFRFTRKTLSSQIDQIYKEMEHVTGRHRHLKKLFHSHYFGWTLPVLGAFIIASPLPDELGVSLMGISRMTVLEFITISGLSHTMGMVAILMTGMIARG
jgi:hypothetical protein